MKYFNPIHRLIAIVKSLNLDNLAYDITLRRETQELIIKFNTKDQLYDLGIDATGRRLDSIGGGYAPLTISIKQSTNLPTDRVTLFQTGAFYETFVVEPFKGGFDIFADTIKDGDDLMDSWGGNILGLTDDNKRLLVLYYRDEIIKAVKEKFRSI